MIGTRVSEASQWNEQRNRTSGRPRATVTPNQSMRGALEEPGRSLIRRLSQQLSINKTSFHASYITYKRACKRACWSRVAKHACHQIWTLPIPFLHRPSSFDKKFFNLFFSFLFLASPFYLQIFPLPPVHYAGHHSLAYFYTFFLLEPFLSIDN